MYSKTLWFSLLFGLSAISPLWAQVPEQELLNTFAPCAGSPSGRQITSFGNSRAWQLASYGEILQNTEVPGAPGVKILAPGQIDIQGLQGLWQGFATVTEIPSSDSQKNLAVSLIGFMYWRIITAFVPPLGLFAAAIVTPEILKIIDSIKGAFIDPVLGYFDNSSNHLGTNWTMRLAQCQAMGLGYRFASRTYISLGGGDMLKYYDYMEVYDGLLRIIFAIQNPKAFMEGVITGRPRDLAFREYFWMWNYEMKEDEIVYALVQIRSYILGPLGQDPTQPRNRAIWLSVAPFLTKGSELFNYFNILDPNDFRAWLRLNFFTVRLNMKATMALTLGEDFVVLDSFTPFWFNITSSLASLQFPTYFAVDGIHFSGTGATVRRQMVLAKMALLGWFQKNPAVPDFVLSQIVAGAQVTLPSSGGGGPLHVSTCVDAPCGARWFEYTGFQLEAGGGVPCADSFQPYNFTPTTLWCNGLGCAGVSASGFFSAPPSFCATIPGLAECSWTFPITVTDCATPTPNTITVNGLYGTGL